MTTIRKLFEEEVTFDVTTEPEDVDVEDCFDDPRDIASIRERLEAGDDAAWCIVVVKARWGSYRGYASLGGCSLSDDYTEDTVVTEHDLKSEALDNLNQSIAAGMTELASLVVR